MPNKHWNLRWRVMGDSRSGFSPICLNDIEDFDRLEELGHRPYAIADFGLIELRVEIGRWYADGSHQFLLYARMPNSDTPRVTITVSKFRHFRLYDAIVAAEESWFFKPFITSDSSRALQTSQSEHQEENIDE